MAVDVLGQVMAGKTLRSKMAWGVAVEQLQLNMEEWVGKVPADSSGAADEAIRVLIQDALKLETARMRLMNNAGRIGIELDAHSGWNNMSEGIATDMMAFVQILCEYLKLPDSETLLMRSLVDAGLMEEPEGQRDGRKARKK